MSELLERLVAEASELQFDRFTLDDEPFAQLAHGRSSTLIARRSSMAA